MTSDGTVSEPQILDALRAVEHPDLKQDIVSLGLVKDVRNCAGSVAFAVELTTPSFAKDAIQAKAQDAVLALDGIHECRADVRMRVTASRPVLGDKGMIPGVRNVIAVSSGKGGVGKSTVAVNLACALSKLGARVGIMDADVYGPNVPLMLGVKGEPQVVDKRIIPFEKFGMQIISMGLLVAEDQAVIWRGPMLHSAIRQFLFEVQWNDLDYLIVDLPPGTGDAQLSLSQSAHLMGAVIVTTPQDVSVLDVKKAVRMFQTVNVPVVGVIENMSWFTPPGSTERYHLFGEGGGKIIEETFGVPLLGQIPLEVQVREGGDGGTPIVMAAPDTESAKAIQALAVKLAERVETLNAE